MSKVKQTFDIIIFVVTALLFCHLMRYLQLAKQCQNQHQVSLNQ